MKSKMSLVGTFLTLATFLLILFAFSGGIYVLYTQYQIYSQRQHLIAIGDVIQLQRNQIADYHIYQWHGQDCLVLILTPEKGTAVDVLKQHKPGGKATVMFQNEVLGDVTFDDDLAENTLPIPMSHKAAGVFIFTYLH